MFIEYVENFNDLRVYQLARSMSKEIFKLTKTFPDEETFALIDQIRRASRSIGAQIAEAWGKRRYESHFISKLTDADSEQFETKHWLETAYDCEYISEDTLNELTEDCHEIGRMLQSMIDKSDQFCLETELEFCFY